MAITGLQLKLSLAADSMSYQAAAEKFGTNKSQISEFIKTGVGVSEKIINDMEDYFKSVGHEYIGATGLHVRTEYTYWLKGTDGFRKFLTEVYEAARDAKEKEEFCIFNGAPDLIVKWVGKDWYDGHRKRMISVRENIDFQVIVEKGTKNLIGSDFAEYRYWCANEFIPEMIYIYGERMAFISFLEDTVEIRVNANKRQANAMRFLFQPAWEKAERNG